MLAFRTQCATPGTCLRKLAPANHAHVGAIRCKSQLGVHSLPGGVSFMLNFPVLIFGLIFLCQDRLFLTCPGCLWSGIRPHFWIASALACPLSEFWLPSYVVRRHLPHWTLDFNLPVDSRHGLFVLQTTVLDLSCRIIYEKELSLSTPISTRSVHSSICRDRFH